MKYILLENDIFHNIPQNMNHGRKVIMDAIESNGKPSPVTSAVVVESHFCAKKSLEEMCAAQEGGAHLPDLLAVNGRHNFGGERDQDKVCHHNCVEKPKDSVGEEPVLACSAASSSSDTRLTEEIDRELNAIIKITLSGTTSKDLPHHRHGNSIKAYVQQQQQPDTDPLLLLLRSSKKKSCRHHHHNRPRCGGGATAATHHCKKCPHRHHSGGGSVDDHLHQFKSNSMPRTAQEKRNRRKLDLMTCSAASSSVTHDPVLICGPV